jgi:predicted nucleic acid-binding protein
MIVVSDTTPLSYLILINTVDILPKLFDEVYVPTSVLRELADARAPAGVRQWTQSPPAWLRIEDPALRLPSTASLDPGEADAISLAKERGIFDILIDDYAGRKVALAEGLTVLPTLAVLERAAETRLLELRPALEALQRTSYRVRREMIEAALERDVARNRVPEGN